MEPSNVLFLLAAFQVKHFICDGPLQTAAMVRDKAVFLKPLGLLHAGLHGLGTALVCVSASLPLGTAAAYAIVDFLVHYCVDFTKENTVLRAGWTIKQAYFWWALSFDQLLHHLTYLTLVYWITS
jgi:hypothetical protein